MKRTLSFSDSGKFEDAGGDVFKWDAQCNDTKKVMFSITRDGEYPVLIMELEVESISRLTAILEAALRLLEAYRSEA